MMHRARIRRRVVHEQGILAVINTSTGLADFFLPDDDTRQRFYIYSDYLFVLKIRILKASSPVALAQFGDIQNTQQASATPKNPPQEGEKEGRKKQGERETKKEKLSW